MEKRNLKHNKKGYTLVEVVTVLAVIAIVAGAAVYGIIAYQRYAAFRRNNEYAKTVFTAAQSALTHYKASGELEELEGKLTSDNIVPAGVAGKDGEYAGRLYSLMIQGGHLNTNEANLLRELLDDYIMDEQIWNASICVEFDPLDGTVYAVCYSDKADAFTYYGEAGTVSDGVMDITDRSEETRKEICLGYYDADLSDRSPSAYGKPSIAKVELVNGETLDLKWWMGLKDRSITRKLTYSVRLYDEDGKLRIAFSIKGSDLKSIGSEDETVLADVYTYIGDGVNLTEQKLGQFTFRAYINENNVVYLTLDGLDVEADEMKLAGEEGVRSLQDTYSALRLGLDPSFKYYAKVQASGKEYKASGWLGSTREQLLFADKNNKGEFIIKNARHLYNIRFLENENGGENNFHSYVQEGRVDWAGNEGILVHGKVFQNGKTIKFDGKAESATPEFPAVKQLNKNSTYTAKKADSADYAIANMVFRTARLENNEGLGLFASNKGKITNVTFENTVVDGSEASYVGTLCGKNEGSLSGITIKKGTVQGSSFVGGIAGADTRDSAAAQADGGGENVIYASLKNGAEVWGTGENVGGVIGALDWKAKDALVTVEGASNTGKVHGKESVSGKEDKPEGTAEPKETKNIGGIVGKAANAKLHQCTSRMPYSDADAKKSLVGTNVGGIAGEILNTSLSGCTTGGGYVYGGTNVGGIVGVVAADESGAFSKLDGKGSKNNADVLGSTNVGGIVGRNEGEVIQWTNTGMVLAQSENAGGITGWNGENGRITDCISNVNISSASGDDLLERAEALGGNGSCIGGLAGYNNGTIEFRNTLLGNKVVSVVAGNNYVGGIIGYNDVKGQLTGYRLGGGYIAGNCFVGGVCGVNLSYGLFRSEIMASPNRVTGNFYVGGIVGGNLVPLSMEDLGETGYDADIYCSVNNFLGSVTANGAFGGGYIGYNYNLVMDNENDPEKVKAWLADMTEITPQTVMEYIRLRDPVDSENDRENSFGLRIKTAGNAYAENVLGKINGGLYIGGVVGFNSERSGLEINRVINETPVTAKAAVADDTYGTGKTYSYAGGIIGYAGERVKISQCYNAGSGSVVSGGSYTGGLTEINRGEIEDCRAGSLAGTTEFVGGIAGVNTGSIKKCSVTGNISGRGNVGGIVSENIGGSIEQTTISGTVRGTGKNIGGVAGCQAAGNTEIRDAVLNGSIIGSGTNVGGIVGKNEGLVSNLRMGNGVSVTGTANVGGYIGSMSAGSLTDLTNTARVTAQAGNAGGIAGEMKSGSYVISNCHNRGNVLADRAGNAGGITAVNSLGGTIRDCTEEGSDESGTGIVIANKGSIGGIAASNAGLIKDCTVSGRGAAAGLSFSANQYAGGMAAVNSGVISGGNVRYIRINNQSVSRESAIGAVTGSNRGKIEDTAVSQAKVYAYADGTSAGGVAGINEGTGDTQTAAGAAILGVKTDADIGFAGASAGALKGSLGGITGMNQSGSRIENAAFTGSITGNSGAAYGYGGIAGVNQAEIKNCTVSARTAVDGEADTLLRVTGTSGDIPNAGGAAGRNGSSGSIEGVTVVQGKLTASGYAYLGGAAGYNDGSIRDCGSEGTKRVNITGEHGHIGGMAGFNGAAGSLNSCETGTGWLVEKTQHGTDEAIGGIIGYNTSGKDLADLHNQAVVNHSAGSSNSAGGIMGRQEVQASASWVLKNCRNDGAVTGKERVGGIIGQWKYNGGTLEKCENYGAITSNTKVSGIVGMLYSITENSKLYFNQCYNEGTITIRNSESSCAGMLGFTNAVDSTVRVYFNECINAGNLSMPDSQKEGGGITAKVEKGTYTFTRCRNYGRLTEKGIMSGIAAQAGNKPVLKQCVGIDTIKYPLTNQSIDTDGTQNYFIARSATSGAGKGQRLLAGKNSGGSYYAENNGLGVKIDNLEIDPRTYTSRTSADICRDVEKNLPAFYEDLAKNENKLENPESLVLNDQEAEYVFSWKENRKAQYMDIKVCIYNEETDQEPVYTKELTVYQGNSVRFNAEEEWAGKYMNISIQAVSAKEGCSSDVVWWMQTPQKAGTLFTPPEVYLQLVDQASAAGSKIYQIVLANQEAYMAYESVEVTVKLDANGNQTQSGTMTIYPQSNTVTEGYIEGNIASKPMENKVITMTIQAKGTMEAGKKEYTSRPQSYQTNVPPFTSNTGAITAKGSNCGFKGATEDMLTYQQELTTSVGATYVRTEILAYDTDADTEVVVNALVSEISESGSTLVRLSDLAQEVKANVINNPTGLTVRSYPWQSKNRLARYGQTGAEGLTAEQVQDYLEVKSDGVKTVKSGYVIERRADNTYTVLYSPLLKNYQKQILTTKVTKLAVTSKPEIGEMKKEGTKLTFQWDMQAGSKASYNATLTGYKKLADGSEESVQLAAETDLAKKTLEADSSGWRYNRLELRVSRIGTVNNYNWTQTLGLSSIRSFDIKLPLESIAVPACEVIDKDDLYYRVSWSGIQDPVEQGELKGYTVWGTVDGRAEKLGETADTGEAFLQTSVDLDAYAGKTIRIYIVANVKEDAVMYSDSEAGAYREIKVPNRLPAPDLADLTLENSYQEDLYIMMDQYVSEGIEVSIGEGNTAGTYMIDAAIYDSGAAHGENGAPAGNLVRSLTDTRGQVMEVKDGKPAFTVRPETKEEAAKYAAQYLFVRFKTTDSSQISSKWTKYICLRLPRVRLETIGLLAQTMENLWQMADMEYLYATNHAVTWTETAGDTTTAGYSVKVKTVRDNAYLTAGSDYDLKLLRTRNSSGGFVFQAVIPNLQYQNSNDPEYLSVILNRDEEYESDDYDLYTADITDLSWELTGQYDTGVEYTADVCMKVQALVSKDTGDIIYRLILPDTEEMEESAEVLAYTGSEKFIQQMDVQAVPADGQVFEISKRMRWYRQTIEEGGHTKDVIRVEEVEDDVE